MLPALYRATEYRHDGVPVRAMPLPLYAIASAAVPVMAMMPQVTTGPSFQMSFLALACLIAF